ncbi:hypothetical protein LUZ60_013391 [Juncus effusus]|nr:hypothetical protein LUZ60_013391 [Juncus effusus]
MHQDLRVSYWWPGMRREIGDFVSRCLVCQQVKAEQKKPAGLLQPLPLKEGKFEGITMDFVTGLPRTRQGNNAVWVIVDRLIKVAHFIPFKYGTSGEEMARSYMRTIFRHHGTPVEIVSDRDTRFTSKFWEGFQAGMGTKLTFSTAYHPQMDGQSERTIETLEDMLRACAITMAPFEALYGKRCRTPLFWDPVGSEHPLGPDLVQESADHICMVKERLKTAHDRQKKYADPSRRHLEFQPGDHVLLRVSPTCGVMRFGVKGKLSPRYIGPFEILERIGPCAYRLALSPSLAEVHNVFHVSQLRKYLRGEGHVLDFSELRFEPSLNYEEAPVAVLDNREQVLRSKIMKYVKVKWSNHSEREANWEREEDIRKRYPNLLPPLPPPPPPPFALESGFGACLASVSQGMGSSRLFLSYLFGIGRGPLVYSALMLNASPNPQLVGSREQLERMSRIGEIA